jgi:Holliday junction DNA helicase RuvA
VREDALLLYGFASLAERDVFRLLTGVPQVGPKLAITVLGGFPLVELLGAIASGERATLERIPGIGRRTAERILLDLKDKVVPLLELLAGDRPAVAATAPGRDQPLREEAREVLVGLGWKPKPVEAALDKVLAEDADGGATLDALVRRALAQLMAR